MLDDVDPLDACPSVSTAAWRVARLCGGFVTVAQTVVLVRGLNSYISSISLSISKLVGGAPQMHARGFWNTALVDRDGPRFVSLPPFLLPLEMKGLDRFITTSVTSLCTSYLRCGALEWPRRVLSMMSRQHTHHHGNCHLAKVAKECHQLGVVLL